MSVCFWVIQILTQCCKLWSNSQSISLFDIHFVRNQVMQTDIEFIAAIQFTYTLSAIANSVIFFLLFQCKYHVDVEIDIKWALPISVQLPITLRSPPNQSVSNAVDCLIIICWQSIIDSCSSIHHQVMMHTESLESTKEGYDLLEAKSRATTLAFWVLSKLPKSIMTW